MPAPEACNGSRWLLAERDGPGDWAEITDGSPPKRCLPWLKWNTLARFGRTSQGARVSKISKVPVSHQACGQGEILPGAINSVTGFFASNQIQCFWPTGFWGFLFPVHSNRLQF